jgi:hypothetical protein
VSCKNALSTENELKLGKNCCGRILPATEVTIGRADSLECKCTCRKVHIFCQQQKARVFNRYPEMPISASYKRDEEILGPETIALLAVVLEDALHQLRLVDHNDPAVTIVAKTMIEFARHGERDPIRLRDVAVESFRKTRSPLPLSPT